MYAKYNKLKCKLLEFTLKFILMNNRKIMNEYHKQMILGCMNKVQ